MTAQIPGRVVRLALDDALHARLAADAILGFAVAVLRDGDAAASSDIVVTAIRPEANGKRRLGAFLMALQSGGGAQPGGELRFGPYTLDAAYSTLVDAGGQAITLTEKERDILLRLHREDGAPLDRKTLLDDVWGYADSVETHTLETHIYRLRRKIEADPAMPRWLVTEGQGYRLAGKPD